MTGYCADTRVGRVHAGETDTIFYPRVPRDDRYGVVLCHGAGEPDEFYDGVSQRHSVILAAAIASAGIPCISGDFAGEPWGNSTGMARITAARSVLGSTFPNMDTAKVCLLGVSHGASMAARYSILNPSSTAAVVGIIPAFDVKYEWDNVPSARASIGAAWGVTYPTALPSGADNRANAAAARSVPLLAGYSTADTIVLPTGVTNYVTAVGGTPLVISTSVDHSDALVGLMPVDTVIDFLRANGA